VCADDDGIRFIRLRSNDMRRVDLLVSDDWKKLLVVYRRAVSVDYYYYYHHHHHHSTHD